MHEKEINIIKQEAKALAKTQKIPESEAYTLLYSWIYAQLDTKAHHILVGRLTALSEYTHSIRWDKNFHPQEDYEKLIANLQAADAVYQRLIRTHGSKALKDATGKIIKTSDGQSVLMFKSTTE